MSSPLILFFIFGAAINIALAVPGGRLPSAYAAAYVGYAPEHCIQMTPYRKEQVNSIVAKLSEFLYNLASDYDDLDIRLVQVVVENHSEDEVEEKETQVHLVVNDCAFVDDVQRDYDRFNVRRDTYDETMAEMEATLQREIAAIVAGNTVDINSSDAERLGAKRGYYYKELPGTPEVFWLELDQAGSGEVRRYRETYGDGPLLVYVTTDCDNNQHLFFN